MLIASEAAKQSRLVVLKHQTEELMKIDKGIRDEVAKGSTEYIYDGSISEAAKNELERCGYKVSVCSQYNIDFVRIKW